MKRAGPGGQEQRRSPRTFVYFAANNYDAGRSLLTIHPISYFPEESCMSTVTIKTRENGPLLISGPIQLTDHLGAPFNLQGKETVALCRCGQTGNRPFCDGSHRTCGWVAAETAPQG
ncbi:MAG: CDGSH iron-sulfur domain-containing protein [Planctomycetales bacterium]